MGAARSPDGRVRILFVCLGNICRSPTAEGVMRALVRDAGLRTASSSTSRGHRRVAYRQTRPTRVRRPPRASAGIALEGAARQIERSDFAEFDLILAMDASNVADLRRIAPDEAERARRSGCCANSAGGSGPQSDRALDVPDPYYGGRARLRPRLRPRAGRLRRAARELRVPQPGEPRLAA